MAWRGRLTDSLGRVFHVERLDVGVYCDEAGGLHLIPAEILEAHGYSDTPENRAMLMSEAEAMLRAMDPEATLDKITVEGRHIRGPVGTDAGH